MNAKKEFISRIEKLSYLKRFERWIVQKACLKPPSPLERPNITVYLLKISVKRAIRQNIDEINVKTHKNKGKIIAFLGGEWRALDKPDM